MVTSLLSLSKSGSSLSTSASTSPVVKLYSLQSMTLNKKLQLNPNKKLRIIHLIRHAEGYHNVNKDYKNPAHIDAELTPNGIRQCQALSEQLRLKLLEKSGKEKDEEWNDHLFRVQCIISSPMRRALQTAQHSFEHQLRLNNQNNDNNEEDESLSSRIPIVACEAWRETVNYLCDKRLPTSQLCHYFPFVDFEQLIQSQHENDPIWDKYEAIYGTHDAYTKRRESVDDDGLRQRAQLAWEFLKHRPESNIAVVSHSAFFMHMFTRKEIGVVMYENEEVEKEMTERPFENCEMRSIAFEILD